MNKKQIIKKAPVKPKTKTPATSLTAGNKELEYVIEVINEIANRNLTIEINPDKFKNQLLKKAILKMATTLVNDFGEIAISSTLTDKTTSTMKVTAKSMRDNASSIQKSIKTVVTSTEEMRQNMNTVSASAEELSANMQSIANAAQQSNENVGSIQVSIKELTTASRDIAENTARATTISKKAMENVVSALARVSELTESAKAIDVVTETISEISDQTKLLALNATIEAARAGEMGKGFAVVAREVKELASQTNTATKDIQGKIGIIHEVTRRTAEAINAINDVMKSVNEAITSIAAAAEEQSATTNSIAHNVVSTTERIKDMSNNVSEGAIAIQDVSKSLLDATNLSHEVARSISSLNANAVDVQNEAVISYAQSLEVAGESSDIKRTINMIKVPERITTIANNTPLLLCRYSNDFDVLIERMNDDHRKIFDYINTIHSRIKEKTDNKSLLPIFKELAEFTRGHFAREEAAMAQADYIDLGLQQKAHEKLLKSISDMINDLENENAVDLLEVMTFLRDWLMTHIMVMDRKYGPVLKERGVS